LVAPTKIAVEFSTDGRTYRVSWPQTRLAGVAEPSERASYDVEDAEGDLMAVSVKVSDEKINNAIFYFTVDKKMLLVV